MDTVMCDYYSNHCIYWSDPEILHVGPKGLFPQVDQSKD
jgi:hypothetical protein